MDLLPVGEATDLARERRPADYSPAEQAFSGFVQRMMQRLLRGDEDDLVLMRRYCGERREISFFMPRSIDRAAVRPVIAEGIVTGVLRFLNPFAPGGPVAQERTDGLIVETQTFPTHYPHIVVERLDVFPTGPGGCPYTEWRAVRVQNQRKSTLVNRALDFTNIFIEIVKAVRP